MTTEIRALDGDDWSLLRDVRLRALADAPDAFGATLDGARALGEQDWRDRATAGLVLVAVEDGVGLALGGALVPEGGVSAYVWGMWTDPAARGRGLAGRLLDQLVAWCRPRSEEVLLHVAPEHDGARRLYVDRGFRPTGTRVPLREGSSVLVEELRLA